jgi:hypothetical protein
MLTDNKGPAFTRDEPIIHVPLWVRESGELERWRMDSSSAEIGSPTDHTKTQSNGKNITRRTYHR